jgi:hypothetical protein
MRNVSVWRLATMVAALAALQGIAFAQVLYKWTDKDGRVQYSDQPPKNSPGPVTRIEPDEKATPGPTTDPGVPKATQSNDSVHQMIDMAAKKRAEREKLEERVTAARDKLAAAKAELENATPGDDERQVIQQRLDAATPLPGAGSSSTGGMLGMGGMLGGTPRSNCKTANNSNGTPVTMCPTIVPGEAYYDRVKQLEDAVKSAEDELAAAEYAYRRGVD